MPPITPAVIEETKRLHSAAVQGPFYRQGNKIVCDEGYRHFATVYTSNKNYSDTDFVAHAMNNVLEYATLCAEQQRRLGEIAGLAQKAQFQTFHGQAMKLVKQILQLAKE